MMLKNGWLIPFCFAVSWPATNLMSNMGVGRTTNGIPINMVSLSLYSNNPQNPILIIKAPILQFNVG